MGKDRRLTGTLSTPEGLGGATILSYTQKLQMLDAFTDYPIECYGDVAGEKAPIRRATILTYDRNKYCDVLVYQVDEDGDLRGTVVNFKCSYLYKNEARLDGDILFTYKELETLPWTKVSYPHSI